MIPLKIHDRKGRLVGWLPVYGSDLRVDTSPLSVVLNPATVTMIRRGKAPFTWSLGPASGAAVSDLARVHPGDRMSFTSIRVILGPES